MPKFDKQTASLAGKRSSRRGKPNKATQDLRRGSGGLALTPKRLTVLSLIFALPHPAGLFFAHVWGKGHPKGQKGQQKDKQEFWENSISTRVLASKGQKGQKGHPTKTGTYLSRTLCDPARRNIGGNAESAGGKNGT